MPFVFASQFLMATRPGRVRGAAGSRPVLAMLLLALVIAGCQIPPDIAHMPRYIWDSWTNPNFVVNAPVLHDLFGFSLGVPKEAVGEARFRLPPGFVMNVFAEDVTLARFMKVTAEGDVIVTQPRKKRVLLLKRDADGDGRADGRRVLLDDLHLPHGVELVGDQLFVAGPEYILRVGFDVEAGELTGEPETFAELPAILGHSQRPLRLGPDGQLYTSIGANCNACEPSSEREQTILRFDLETGREEIVARGFRNVGHFDWQPGTGSMFATEVGVDYAGEEFPLEELNRIEAGRFYGFPYLHGPDYPDPELAPENADRIAESTPPVHTFTAHSTPLGITFLRNEALPEDYRSAALVVLKGSWNRVRKSGYKVVSLHWAKAEKRGEDGARIEQREFLTGFERDEDVIGRPVDIVEGPAGSLFLSDDTAGAIYRIRYVGKALTEGVNQKENAFAFQPKGVPPDFGSDPPRFREEAARDETVRAALEEQGAELFARHACATCHGASATRPAAVSLADLAVRRSVADVVWVLSEPPPAMPRFLLTETERRALAYYLLAPERS